MALVLAVTAGSVLAGLPAWVWVRPDLALPAHRAARRAAEVADRLWLAELHRANAARRARESARATVAALRSMAVAQ